MEWPARTTKQASSSTDQGAPRASLGQNQIRFPPAVYGDLFPHLFAAAIPADVRFGSKADINAGSNDVRFTPESGHHRRPSSCLLCAKSGPWISICTSSIASRATSDDRSWRARRRSMRCHGGIRPANHCGLSLIRMAQWRSGQSTAGSAMSEMTTPICSQPYPWGIGH